MGEQQRETVDKMSIGASSAEGMKKSISALFALLVSLAWFATATEPEVSITKIDGSTVEGKVISKSAKEVLLETRTGPVRISTSQLDPSSKKRLDITPEKEISSAQYSLLEAKVAALELENQSLRKQLQELKASGGKSIGADGPPPASTTGVDQTKSAAKGTGFSLSASGKRHNSRCRFYDAAKACNQNEGTACKICGG